MGYAPLRGDEGTFLLALVTVALHSFIFFSGCAAYENMPQMFMKYFEVA